jgi:hypothetical protein
MLGRMLGEPGADAIDPVHEQFDRPAPPAQRLAERGRRTVDHDDDVQVRGGGPARGQHAAAEERGASGGEAFSD